MTAAIECPECGETSDLSGAPSDGDIQLTCGKCGHTWARDLRPACPTCHEGGLVPANLAIVERSRGTQLSVVGTRVIHLCPGCDADTLERYQRNRPNPLMPDDLPTVGPEQA